MSDVITVGNLVGTALWHHDLAMRLKRREFKFCEISRLRVYRVGHLIIVSNGCCDGLLCSLCKGIRIALPLTVHYWPRKHSAYKG